MKKIILFLLILGLIMLSSCDIQPLTIFGPVDNYVKLSNPAGTDFVKCSENQECISYLNGFNIQVNSECRENFCYYESTPTVGEERGPE